MQKNKQNISKRSASFSFVKKTQRGSAADCARAPVSEEAQDISDSLRALGDLKSGKTRGISWNRVKAKYGL